MTIKKLAKEIKDRETAQDHAFAGPLHPSLSLLCKLGSCVVHAEEFLSPGGHQFDAEAIRGIVNDPEIRTWINAMGPFMPVKR